jgi:hypothetical protein
MYYMKVSLKILPRHQIPTPIGIPGTGVLNIFSSYRVRTTRVNVFPAGNLTLHGNIPCEGSRRIYRNDILLLSSNLQRGLPPDLGTPAGVPWATIDTE